MHAGTAGAAGARELAGVWGAVAPEGGGWCRPRLPPTAGGVLLGGPSPHPRAVGCAGVQAPSLVFCGVFQ